MRLLRRSNAAVAAGWAWIVYGVAQVSLARQK